MSGLSFEGLLWHDAKANARVGKRIEWIFIGA